MCFLVRLSGGGFREYLAGLLAPRDRNKTLTCLAGAEPVEGAGHAAVQRLQYFLSESTWDSERVNDRRLELLLADPATAPHAGGVLAIDDSGDRKDGTRTAHVGRQWLGRYGKTDNGIVTVTTLWADDRVYYPLHVQAYTPAARFPKGRTDSDFRTKLQIAADLVAKAKAAGVVCRAVVADSFYGDHDDLRAGLRQTGWGFVMALKPSRGSWQYGADAYTPRHAARAVEWGGPDDPGGWTPVHRRFRDGHTETWWAAEATLGWWGPDGHTRLVVATTDPGTLPDNATWYLATNLPRPGGPHDTPDAEHEPADLAEVVRLYGLRNWIEQSYKQVKTNSAGPTSKSAPPSRSAATKPRQLRRHVLLEHLVRTILHKRQSKHDTTTGAGHRRLRREGAPERLAPSRPRPGPKLYEPSEPGSHPGESCNAGGTPGPTSPCLNNSNSFSTPPPKDKDSARTYRRESQQTTAR